MAKKKALVVVLGYGCHLTESMKHYLDSVVSFVADNDVEAIIVTGGCTNLKSAPGISEARMMASYLKDCWDKAPVFLEEVSVTTNDNLQNVAKILVKESFSCQRIVLFCSETHAVKVKLLARLILGCWPEVRTYELTKGLVPKLKQVFVATPLDVLALYIPFFGKLQLQRKEHIMKNA